MVFAKIAVNVINYYGTAQRFADLEHWGQLLQRVATDNPTHSEIQLELAQGAVNAIIHYGPAQRYADLERWGQLLQGVATDNPTHSEIQLELAQGAVSSMLCYGSSGQLGECERWTALFAQALPRSSVDPGTMQAMVNIAFSLLDEHPTVATSLHQIFNRYWPGCLRNLPNQQSAPLCLVVSEQFSEDQQQADKTNLQRCYELANDIQTGKYDSTATLTQAVAELWPLRMYLPDRGDSLVPLLQQLQMEKQLQEAKSDPWRRSEQSQA
jgi:hypothetical protein